VASRHEAAINRQVAPSEIRSSEVGITNIPTSMLMSGHDFPAIAILRAGSAAAHAPVSTW
jgi:hypothetical protein